MSHNARVPTFLRIAASLLTGLTIAASRRAAQSARLHAQLHSRRQGLRPRQHRHQRRSHQKDGRGEPLHRRRLRLTRSLHRRQSAPVLRPHLRQQQQRSLLQRRSARRLQTLHPVASWLRCHPLRLRLRALLALLLAGCRRKFVEHPRLQTFTVHVAEPNFPATEGLPTDFSWTDECYFTDHQSPDIHPILTTDRTRLAGLDKMTRTDPNTYPNPLPWPGTTPSTAAARSTSPSDTARRITAIPSSTTSSGVAFFGPSVENRAKLNRRNL